MIKVENIGKKYIIGHEKQARYSTLRDSLSHGVKSVARRLCHPLQANTEQIELEEFWALKDINFEIQQGDKVGIIGRNGAGKSTLLKILSRITAPTTGKITLKGRVASLLEVGTGFHPELSGRENIYLNGAILGMRKAEIKRKFDEIVDFAEVEKFLDTPVKRYSSGMYVKLAFAVAAHLEPDILIVDEVLAVGDTQFQKKCLGKMQDVNAQGRTVLFVSHNMGAINELCSRAILLNQGEKLIDGNVKDVVTTYLTNGQSNADITLHSVIHYGHQSYARLQRLRLFDDKGNPASTFMMNTPFVAHIEVECISPRPNVEIGLKISSRYGAAIHYLTSTWEGLFVDLEPGKYIFEVKIPHLLLYPGNYLIGLWILSEPDWSDDHVQEVAQFTVIKNNVTGYRTRFDQYVVSGCEVYTQSSWKLISKNSQL
ncbi:ABC transporter ATP-binding protein [Methylomonas sp. LL1]|nr:ABC transporter ATP-binding protein [Methylomonas sp. LL1]